MVYSHIFFKSGSKNEASLWLYHGTFLFCHSFEAFLVHLNFLCALQKRIFLNFCFLRLVLWVNALFPANILLPRMFVYPTICSRGLLGSRCQLSSGVKGGVISCAGHQSITASPTNLQHCETSEFPLLHPWPSTHLHIRMTSPYMSSSLHSFLLHIQITLTYLDFSSRLSCFCKLSYNKF